MLLDSGTSGCLIVMPLQQCKLRLGNGDLAPFDSAIIVLGGSEIIRVEIEEVTNWPTHVRSSENIYQSPECLSKL